MKNRKFLNQEQIEAVIKLPASKRYPYALKQIVAWQEVWGLFEEGWAMLNDDKNVQYLSIWPAKEYANLCADKDWKAYYPKSIPLDEFLTDFIPNLINSNINLSVFLTPEDQGIPIDPPCFVEHINQELEKY